MLNVIIYSFVAGVLGTGIGAVLSIFFAKNGQKTIGFLFSATAGIMLAIVFFDLIKHAQELTGVWFSALGIIIGVFFVLSISIFVSATHSHDVVHEMRNEYKNMGAVLVMAIALHNFPEGLVIGSDYVLNNSIFMAVIIALHNIPEGVAMALPLRLSGEKWSKIIINCLISGLPTVFGAVIGYTIASISTSLIGLCMAIASGAMLFITLSQILPKANKLVGDNKSSIITVLGLILGLILVVFAK